MLALPCSIHGSPLLQRQFVPSIFLSNLQTSCLWLPRQLCRSTRSIVCTSLKNAPNLPEPPRELISEMWIETSGSRSGQVKQITMEPNDGVIVMNLHKTNSKRFDLLDLMQKFW